MAIDYRSVNAEDVETQVKAARAQDAERSAFAAEVEVERLDAVASKVRKKEDKDALKAARDQAKEQADSLRNKASRLNAEAVLDDATSKAIQADFLNSWIASLEQEHVAHSTIIAQREASLASTGADAPGEEEKKEMQARLDESKMALEVIESSWHVATEKLDAIVPDDVVEEETVDDEPVTETRSSRKK